MPRKDTGNKLHNLMLQPGSRFVTTQVGFDVGTRTVVCDSKLAPLLEPVLGASDADISYIMENGNVRKGEHKMMFVNSFEVISESGGVTTMRLDFLGQKLRPGQTLRRNFKPKHYESSVESFEVENDPIITVSLQVLTVTYLAVKLSDLPPLNKFVEVPDYIKQTGPLIDEDSGIILPTPDIDRYQITNRQSIGVGGDPTRSLVPAPGPVGAYYVALSNTHRMFQVTDTISRRVYYT